MNRDPNDNDRSSRPSTSPAQRRAAIDEAEEAKRKLEALFGGKATKAEDAAPTPAPAGGAPALAHRRTTGSGRVFASPRKSTGRTPSDFRLRLERLRNARTPEDIETAADAFLKFHQLPDEVDILFKVLQHRSEQVVRDAMGQLSALLMQGRLQGTLLLADHLGALSKRATEEATHHYIAGLRQQIEALGRG